MLHGLLLSILFPSGLMVRVFKFKFIQNKTTNLSKEIENRIRSNIIRSI